ncbi:hypothetical protein D8674_028903 [Pyrus ussuriensis x Pyrus communis]|uniref:Uncharacterized protein n=1 Tax=Pyrus ussuriensis x Pyrus communis TaxID=2448454 RepID=A0A5N5HXL7_9ROSA|nr:hypothetical protein D8674_028903 [Pyrus ussuriensis x Pyrus communis]
MEEGEIRDADGGEKEATTFDKDNEIDDDEEEEDEMVAWTDAETFDEDDFLEIQDCVVLIWLLCRFLVD